MSEELNRQEPDEQSNTPERQECAAENIFPSIFRAVKNTYPEYYQKLERVGFAKVDFIHQEGKDDPNGAYESVNNVIMFRKDFIDGLSQRGAAQQIVDAQSIMHEFIHAISYCKIEKYDEEGKDVSSFTGIEHRVIVNKREKKERGGLNEFLTNFFALKALPAAAENSDEEKRIIQHRDRAGSWRVGNALTKLVGEDVLMTAYFEGDFDMLRQALNRKGVNAEEFIDVCDSLNPNKVLDMLSDYRGTKNKKKK